ncbi:multimerin-2 isoform X2 [Emydura macquarii macquarii]
MKSQLVTYTVACKKEKYVIKSQQPCSNGAPADCQKIMYRATLKPVYRVKQKVLKSLYWKCCSGFIGENCEHRDPNFVPVPDNHTEGLEDGEEFSNQMSTSLQAEEIMKTIQNRKALLEDLQNDIHQSAGDLQRLLENNITTMTSKMNQSKSELHERLLQQMLFPHVESFLREHFNPMWATFNKSLQNLSSMVRNLSKDVEANKKSIERFQESTVPKKEFQELGTKFESKVQEKVVRVDQLKREIENHLDMQQATIHYNLTMIKADTDMKLKRYHKIQQSHLLALNTSMSDMKQEQENLEDELETLNRNLTELSLFCGNKDEATWLSIRQLNETLTGHAKKLKELHMESDVAFEDITVLDKWVKELKAKSKRESEEFRVALMEKSLIIEENKEALERQILELNYTLSNLQVSHWDLLNYMRECNCEKVSSDIDIMEEDQKNITHTLEDTQRNVKEVQHLETSFKALLSEIEELSTAFHPIHQSLGYQQEQSRQLMDSMSHLKSQIKILSEDIGFLKKKDEEIHGHIKYLKSSFSSLLEDAMRHETALEALLGAEIMEVLSEENPSTLISSIAQLQEALRHTSNKLKEQNMTLESLTKRFHFLEMGRESNHDAHNFPKHPEHKKQPKNTLEEVTSPHSNVEHMEPNHEAFREDTVDNPAYNDIMTLKREIKHLSMDIKRHQSWRDDRNHCCNHTVVNLVEPFSVSVEILRADLATTKQNLEDHLQIFQKLFGTNEELVASNISLDITKIQSMMTKKMRRQQKGHEKQKRDEKQMDENREHMRTINGKNKIDAELSDEDSSVAFYAGFSEEWDEVKTLKFNETYLNYGNSYFPEQGYFKAPHNGVYMFVINVEFSPGPALGQLVFSNGNRMTLSSSQKKKATGSSVTTFAMADLKKGESVWFELLQGSIAKRSPPGTTMGGFLIFKT